MSLTWNPPRLPRQTTATHENTAPYSPIVALGARRKDGTTIPPRDFMRGAYDGPFSEFDALEEFVNGFQQSGSIARAFRSTAQAANKEQKRLIEANVWPFDRATKRQSGETVTSPRDIVDSGELLRSHQPVRFS